MERKVSASFATRREAELAVEHLVQDHGIERTSIFVRAAGDANSAGTRPAGADIASGHSAMNAQIREPVEISVDCNEAKASQVKAILKEAGAQHLSEQKVTQM